MEDIVELWWLNRAMVCLPNGRESWCDWADSVPSSRMFAILFLLCQEWSSGFSKQVTCLEGRLAVDCLLLRAAFWSLTLSNALWGQWPKSVKDEPCAQLTINLPSQTSPEQSLFAQHILSCLGQGWAVGDPCTEYCVLREGRWRNPFGWPVFLLSLVMKTVQSLENTGKVWRRKKPTSLYHTRPSIPLPCFWP